MNRKIKVAIIGTGNIGTDLLLKIQRSSVLECSIFAGQNPDSKGIQLARKLGVTTSTKSILALEEHSDLFDIAFDATNASSHALHAKILKKLDKVVIDLTPSKTGIMCIPVLNLEECLEEKNISMVTCGGQAMVPIAHAITKVHPETEYIEIVGSIASKSAGPGTRNNIDEYTQTTGDSLKIFSKVPTTKAIIILNPADPPINMHNTLYAEIKNPNIKAIKRSILETVKEIKKYVPGYQLIMDPVLEKNKIIVMVEVIGMGDYLPKYAGNLDIINCAAIKAAEEYALVKLSKNNFSKQTLNSTSHILNANE